ncbi:putative RNA-directed DNA polymerase from transposon BS [Trichonephila clavipes]|nr:putative RNA-directed DNA polymerase from transposon BS [Trichonephila clavipes]
MLLCPGKGLVLPNLHIDQISANTRFLLISLPNNEMSSKSPFAFQKALIGIGGEPKSVKRLRSGDLLMETHSLSALQTKFFLLAKTFLNSFVTISPHKTLNSCHGVISEPDLLITPEAEILEGFSNKGVIQVRRITIKKDTAVIPTKHLILTFSSPTLPQTIKAGYLNFKIRPYIPNHLRCFKCQRLGHSQTSCHGQLTCSRCASWRTEKQIQEIKTNKNISYPEARKLIVPQISQSYAQVAKTSTAKATTQTDETITKIVCPPLKLLQTLVSIPKATISSSVPAVTKSSTSTQAQLLPSTSSVIVTSSSESPPSIPFMDTAAATSNSLSTSTASSSSTLSMSTPLPACPVLETTTTTSSTIPATSQDAKETSKPRRKIRPPKNTSDTIKPKIEIKMAPRKPRKPARTEYTTDEDSI